MLRATGRKVMDTDKLKEQLAAAWYSLPHVNWMGPDAVDSQALSCREYDEQIIFAIVRLITNKSLPDFPDEGYWQLSFRLRFALASLDTPNVADTITKMSELEAVVAIAVHAGYGWHEEVVMWLAYLCNADLKANFSENCAETWVPAFQYEYPIYEEMLERFRNETEV